MGAITIARWITLGALFAVPFVVLVVDPGLLFPYVAGRGFGFRGLVEVACAGWAVLAVRDSAYRPRWGGGSLIHWLLLGYLAWMAVADGFAVNPHRAFWGDLERMGGWVGQVHLLVFFVVAGAVLGAEGLWRRWWLAFVGASALVCGYGALQMAHLARTARGAARVDALSGNPEFLGGYLLFALAATLWLALDRPPEDLAREDRAREDRARGGRPATAMRIGLLALACAQVVILFASGTRGAAVGLVAALGVCGLLALAASGRPRAAAAVAAGGGLAAAVGLAVLRSAPANPLLGRFAHMGAGELGTRFSLWRMAWEAFLARPLSGWGHEGFIYAFNRFYDPGLRAEEPWFDRAHDLYLDTLVAGGAPALLLWLAILAAGAAAIWRAPISRAGRIALLGGLVAYGVQGLVVFDSLMTELPLMALLAMAAGWGGGRRASAPGAVEARRGDGVLLAGAMVGAAAVFWMVNLPTLAASRDLVTALAPRGGGPVRLAYLERAMDAPGFAGREVQERAVKTAALVAATPDGPETEKRLFVDHAIAAANHELAAHPHEARLRLELARLHRILGDREAARREIGLAQADAPRHPQVLEEARRIAAAAP